MRFREESGGDDPRVGTTVAARYFLHRRLGRGGMGDVYEATRLDDDRRVALKLLRAGPDEDRLRRFEREAALTARLRDPGCVEVVESGRDPLAGHFLAMELVRGRDLAQVLEDDGPLAPARAARIADEVLSVLARAHAAGVLHRDLKPANVMLDEAGAVEQVKVLDFGIATFLDPAPGARPLTTEGIAHGTPAYMSPEQIRGAALDPRSDLYAVGALLFEMLAGAAAFDGPTPLAVAARQLTEDAPPLARRRPDVPPALAALVARALAREPARRPESAEAMRAMLREAVPSLVVPSRAGSRAPPATAALPVVGGDAAAGRPGRALRVAAALVAVLALGAGAFALSRGTATTSTATPTLSATPPPTSPPFALSVASPEATRSRRATPTPTPERSPTRRAARADGPPSTSTSTSTSAVAGAGGAADGEAQRAIRFVGAALNSVPLPAGDSGDGLLVIQASPWAMVSVAGVQLGESPREVRLAEGSYEVRGVHPELGEQVGRVEVRAGARTLWSVRLGE